MRPPASHQPFHHPPLPQITGPVILKMIVARHMGLLPRNPPAAPGALSPYTAPLRRSCIWGIGIGSSGRLSDAALAPIPAGAAFYDGCGAQPNFTSSDDPAAGAAAAAAGPQEQPPALPALAAAAAAPADPNDPTGGRPVIIALRPGLIYPYDWHRGNPGFGGLETPETLSVHQACSNYANPMFDRRRCQQLVAPEGSGAVAVSYCEQLLGGFWLSISASG
jgi:hypothetical protein